MREFIEFFQKKKFIREKFPGKNLQGKINLGEFLSLFFQQIKDSFTFTFNLQRNNFYLFPLTYERPKHFVWKKRYFRLIYVFELLSFNYLLYLYKERPIQKRFFLDLFRYLSYFRPQQNHYVGGSYFAEVGNWPIFMAKNVNRA